ncbi:hypothetical protein NT6N_40540 [Oceaniferula spumae]|uniref:Uncharacterized protein n=1 Tax=Oceaniferula spumae TaxID=2979115 RepID=A0AAT9FSS8_9BACT
MKTTIPITALAAFGLAILPVSADDAATAVKPASEQAAAVKKIPVYVLMVSGKG